MECTPILLLVQHALPSNVLALPHVTELINEFTLPSTIDAAVYYALHRVLQLFERFRPYSVGAMDGAAANGRFDIVRRLHYERDEGCSSSAFIGAASNGHLDVLRWLYQYYPGLQQEIQELTEATKHGHRDTVMFLLNSVRLEHSHLNQVLVLAATNGHDDVVRAFLRRFCCRPAAVRGALVAASASGHVSVVKVLLDTNELYVGEALEKALIGEHIEVIELLAKTANGLEITLALRKMISFIGADTIQVVVETCEKDEEVLRRFLEIAAENKRYDLAQVVVAKCPPMEMTGQNPVLGDTRFAHPIQSAVANGILDAADTGRQEMILILTKQRPSYVGDALRHAVLYEKWEVQKLLLQICEGKYLEGPQMAPFLTSMLEQAAAEGDLEVVRQICTKCSTVEMGDALGIAVKNNFVRLASLLIENSEPCGAAVALLEAAAAGQTDMVYTMVARAGHQAVEIALRDTVLSGEMEISSMLLAGCNPNRLERIFKVPPRLVALKFCGCYWIA